MPLHPRIKCSCVTLHQRFEEVPSHSDGHIGQCRVHAGGVVNRHANPAVLNKVALFRLEIDIIRTRGKLIRRARETSNATGATTAQERCQRRSHLFRCQKQTD